MTPDATYNVPVSQEKQNREIQMYGCTESQMKSAVSATLSGRYSTPASIAASILSDAQEMLEYDIKEAGQAINRAKWILFEYYDRKIER